jgi:hypothetical protein
LLLAHLSENNNCPTLVKELFTAHAEGINIVVASRYEETGIYHIDNQVSPRPIEEISAIREQIQLELF